MRVHLRRRCIYVAKTDTGVEGIGEYHDREPQETIDSERPPPLLYLPPHLTSLSLTLAASQPASHE